MILAQRSKKTNTEPKAVAQVESFKEKEQEILLYHKGISFCGDKLCSTLFALIQLYSSLFCLILPYPALSCLILPYLALYCLILPYPAF
ncbi:hypothetical protein, partial [Psittacicella melopsittaci]|uniref:hypothetical protein n=1 Tax=Psittacicella melopsittaci TaxID=2028576 RepID=UPI001CA775A9